MVPKGLPENMKTGNSHYLECEAPICRDYSTEDLLWYPDEKVCQIKPYKNWQKIQMRIKRLFLKGKVNSDKYFSFKMLNNLKIVRQGIEGKNPNVYLA